MDLEMKLADASNIAFAWSLYSEFVRQNMFSGGPGRRAPADWDEGVELKRFSDYWSEREPYIISIDGVAVGWASIVEGQKTVTIENWHIDPKWRNKGITKIVLGSLIPKWKSKGLVIEAELLLNTNFTTVADSILSRFGFLNHGHSQNSQTMRLT